MVTLWVKRGAVFGLILSILATVLYFSCLAWWAPPDFGAVSCVLFLLPGAWIVYGLSVIRVIPMTLFESEPFWSIGLSLLNAFAFIATGACIGYIIETLFRRSNYSQRRTVSHNK